MIEGKTTLFRAIACAAFVSAGFKTWQFRGMLEDRILTADERARAFAAPDSRALPEMMVNSRAGCTGCHQR